MKYFLFVLLLSCTSKASQVPQETQVRISKLYPEQSESFITKRLAAAKSAHEKWTAFPPYFYELLQRLHIKFSDRKGICAGDAHFENFGFLYSKSPTFGLNDLDDASECSLDADAMRLFIGHRLLGNFDTSEWIQSYKRGYQKDLKSSPSLIQDLRQKSLSGARRLTKKMNKILDQKKCQGDFSDLTASEESLLQTWARNSNLEWIHGCSRLKEGGGSAGNRRYIVLYKKNQQIEGAELKPLVRPAPQFDQPMTNDQRKSLYQKSVTFFLGNDFHQDYFPVELDHKLYQRRPLLAGNEAVEVKDLTSQELLDVIYFEARTLGEYHARANAQVFSFDVSSWESLAKKIEGQWRAEFNE